MNADPHALARFVAAHGMTVRRVTSGGVLAAVPAVTAERWLCSELSPLLSTWSEVRRWLGY